MMDKIIYSNWYIEKIEPPIREIVYRLRNVGINTRCSCGHYMWVQGEAIDSQEVIEWIYNILCSMGIKNYKVRMQEDVRDGHRNTWFELSLPDKNGQYHFQTTDNIDFVPNEF